MIMYNFFDYKGFIEGYHGQDFFGLTHKIFMIIATVAIILIGVFGRKMKYEKVDLYLKVISIFVPILEIVKIIWVSYWDIKFGFGFNKTGLLPLYTCSMFIYTLPLAAWCKGKVKDCAVCWLGTIGIFGGLTNFYLTQILNTYPFFTFATFMSLYFHLLMVITGILIVVSGYKKFNWIDGLKGFIPLAIFSVIVIPIDYILKADYMLYYYGNGAPILPDIANSLANLGLRFVFTMLVFFGYLGISYLFVSIYKGLGKLIKIGKKKIS